MNPRPAMRPSGTAPAGSCSTPTAAMGHVAGPRAVELALGAPRHVRFGARGDSILRSPRRARDPRVARGRRRGTSASIGQRTPAAARHARASRGPRSVTTRSPSRARCRRSAPIVFDIACSVAARGHILLAAREGRSIPEGWALDEHGEPTTDTQPPHCEGMLLPVGGHKGHRHRDDGRVPGGRARRDRRFAGARRARPIP